METAKFNLAEVDWSRIWEEGVLFFIGQAEKGNTWDSVAAKWNRLSESDNQYRDQILRRLRLRPQWTVLDAGCGTGLLAVPLAKKVKMVTGLDSSKNMLACLKENAAREKLTNIRIVHRRFEEAVIGRDIERHDVVIASRSFGHEHNLKKFLTALNNSAKRYSYLTWGASDRDLDIAMYQAIGREYGETRTYIIVYNLLYRMGIRANIEIFECSQKGMAYAGPDEAAETLIQRFRNMEMGRALDREEEARLREFFNRALVRTADGTFIYPAKPTKQALIWWRKEADLPAD